MAGKQATRFQGDWTTYVLARHLAYVDLYGSRKASDSLSYEFEGKSIAWLYNAFENGGKSEVVMRG